jgi:hypothetical protein
VDPVVSIIKMIQDLEEQLELLSTERQRVDQQISAVKQSINGLTLLLKATPNPEAAAPINIMLIEKFAQAPRLGEACKNAVNSLGREVTPVEVRDQLNRAGFDFKAYSSNPLSSIHTTLKRLAANQEIRQVRDPDTKKIVGYAPLKPTLASKASAQVVEGRRKK